MITTYDPDADAFYARFAPSEAAVAETREVAPGVMIDLDSTGQLIGVEVLSVTMRGRGTHVWCLANDPSRVAHDTAGTAGIIGCNISVISPEPAMCRFLAYEGEPILLETLVTAPCHSLIHQSMHAAEGKTETNGDGFGVGWYGERDTPGLYRDVRPAWSDENLRSIAAQVRSRLFFAHVRAATGTSTSRANCHPFAHGKFLFMHNGQIGGWPQMRRRVEAMIPDGLYAARTGTTDSEAIFLAALGQGLERDPVGAMQATFAKIAAMMDEAGIADALRFTATLTDGETLWAFRWSTDLRPPSLYYKPMPGGLLLVSEPIDGVRGNWQPVPHGGTLVAQPGRAIELLHARECAAA